MTQHETPNAIEPMRSFARSLPMALLKARESVMVRFRPSLRAHGLTEQQWRVIRAMSAADHRLRPMELSQMTFISMPSLSRLLKTLEGRDLIRRGRHVGNPGHPDVQAAIEHAIARIRHAGKAAGILTANEALARRYLELGCSFVAVGLDTSLLVQATSALATKFKDIKTVQQGSTY